MCHGTEHGHAWVARRYWTAEERTAWLEGYAEELENELTGVKERIARIKGESA